MPRLVPRSTRQIAHLLTHFGFHLARSRKEQVWINDTTGRRAVVPPGRSSGQIPVRTVISILDQAGISREEALGFWGIGRSDG